MKYFDNLIEKIYHCQSYNAYRVARKFCGNQFLRLGQISFSCCELIFAIFRKYPVPKYVYVQ